LSNIGKHSENTFRESEGNIILKNKLISNRRISCFFSENDKTPNTDGFFEFINDKGVPIKRFNVQIKSTEDLKDGKYSLDTKILNYVFSKISTDPTVLFLVDLTNQKIFYRHITVDYLLSIDFDKKKKITVDFSNDSEFNYNKFEKEIELISNEHNRLMVLKNNDEVLNIQEAITYLNDTIFSIPLLVETLFPNLYRIGIATSSDEKEFQFKSQNNKLSTFKSKNNYGVYFINKGEKRFEIEDFNNLGDYSSILYDGIGDSSPEKYARKVVSDLLKIFFNKTQNYITLMPNEVLEEIVFAFLDKLGSKYSAISSDTYHKTFYKDNVKVSEASIIFNKVMKYMWHIIYSKNELYYQEGTLRNLLYRNINSVYHQNGVDFIDLASVYCPREIFEKFELGDELFDNQTNHLLSFLTNEYRLSYYAIKELNSRGIVNINRIWNFEPNKEVSIVGYRQSFYDERFFMQCEKFLKRLPELYNNFIQQLDLKQLEIKKEIKCSINQNNDNFFSIVVNYFSRESEDFIINVVNQLDDVNSEDFITWGYSGIIPEIFETKMPYYYSLTLLVYEMICKKYSLNFEGVLIKNMLVKNLI